MTQRTTPRLLVMMTMILTMLTLAFGVSPASAARDKTKPTTPTNLRVTGMTPYSVSLWMNPAINQCQPLSRSTCAECFANSK